MIVRFDTSIISDSIVRPSDVTAYTAGDVISEATTNDHFTFTNCLREPGRTAMLDWARLTSSANKATKLDAELWLFNTDITEVADNSAFAPTDAEVLTLVGIVAFPVAGWVVGNAGADAAGNAVCEALRLDRTFRALSLNLYGQLVARNAYTPVSGEIFTVTLGFTLD